MSSLVLKQTYACLWSCSVHFNKFPSRKSYYLPYHVVHTGLVSLLYFGKEILISSTYYRDLWPLSNILKNNLCPLLGFIDVTLYGTTCFLWGEWSLIPYNNHLVWCELYIKPVERSIARFIWILTMSQVCSKLTIQYDNRFFMACIYIVLTASSGCRMHNAQRDIGYTW